MGRADTLTLKEAHSTSIVKKPTLGYGLQSQPAAVSLRSSKPNEWSLMLRGTSPVHSDAARDVGVKGYCYFQVSK